MWFARRLFYETVATSYLRRMVIGVGQRKRLTTCWPSSKRTKAKNCSHCSSLPTNAAGKTIRTKLDSTPGNIDSRQRKWMDARTQKRDDRSNPGYDEARQACAAPFPSGAMFCTGKAQNTLTLRLSSRTRVNRVNRKEQPLLTLPYKPEKSRPLATISAADEHGSARIWPRALT